MDHGDDIDYTSRIDGNHHNSQIRRYSGFGQSDKESAHSSMSCVFQFIVLLSRGLDGGSSAHRHNAHLVIRHFGAQRGSHQHDQPRDVGAHDEHCFSIVEFDMDSPAELFDRQHESYSSTCGCCRLAAARHPFLRHSEPRHAQGWDLHVVSLIQVCGDQVVTCPARCVHARRNCPRFATDKELHSWREGINSNGCQLSTQQLFFPRLSLLDEIHA